MENQLIQLVGNSGLAGIVAYVLYKVATKLYDDISTNNKTHLEEAVKREEKLFEYLDKKNETDLKISNTLDNICSEIGCMNRRLEDVENKLEDKSNV